MEVCSTEVCSTEVCSMEVCSTEVCSMEVCALAIWLTADPFLVTLQNFVQLLLFHVLKSPFLSHPHGPSRRSDLLAQAPVEVRCLRFAGGHVLSLCIFTGWKLCSCKYHSTKRTASSGALSSCSRLMQGSSHPAQSRFSHWRLIYVRALKYSTAPILYLLNLHFHPRPGSVHRKCV